MKNDYSTTKASFLERCYVLFVVLSLVMYIFGHSTEFGTLPFPDKMFYIPCAVSLICAFLDRGYWRFSNSDVVFIVFYFITFAYSSIVVGLDIEDMVTSILGFLVFRHLAHINTKQVLIPLAYLSPVIIFIHYYYSNPLAISVGYRYSGFQGDPNCFSFAINVLIYACGFSINYANNKFLKFIALLSIIAYIPLIVAAASRAGVAIMLILVFFTFKDLIKKNKLVASLLIVIALIVGGKYLGIMGNQIETTVDRYADSSEYGDDYRLQEFSIVPAVLSAHPEHILFGIGYSRSIEAHNKYPEYYHEGRAHNTYMSVLLEEGIIGFILFMMFLIFVGHRAWKRRKSVGGGFRLLLYFVTLLFIYTIYSLPFLPFWFAINIVNNQYEIDAV